MTAPLNSAPLSAEAEIAQATTDTLLITVNAQVQSGCFDSSNADVLQQLVEILGDGRGTTRLRCATILGEIGSPATPVLITALLHHANVVVRRAAAKTLTLIADTTAIPALIQALSEDEDTVVQGSAVGAMARMGTAAVPVLLDILSSPDRTESAKGHAAWALAFIGSEAKADLYREITSELPAVRSAVVGAIAKVAQENPAETQAFQLLVQALTDPAENVRYEAASALGNLAYKPAIPNLIELLHHPEWETRKAGALALMKVAAPETIPALQAALSQEPEAAGQSVIKLAIAQIQRQAAEADWD
jgi:bilin biosynthesis protein